jgi:hypothetical protein
MPHHNWKDKLIRCKYMGNYGHIFKKPNITSNKASPSKLNEVIINEDKFLF